MPKVIFIDAQGEQTEVVGDSGDTLMNVAVNESVDGITAECGGACTCATCHCYIADEWIGKVGEPEEFEADMLEHTESERKTGSRLSCQITLTDDLDGLVVLIPENQ